MQGTKSNFAVSFSSSPLPSETWTSMRMSSHIIRMMLFVSNGQWSSGEFYSRCVCRTVVQFAFFFFFFSRFSVVHTLVIIIQIVHISHFVAARDVTDPFLFLFFALMLLVETEGNLSCDLT